MSERMRRLGRHCLIVAAAAMLFGAGYQSYALLFGLEYEFRPICWENRHDGLIELEGRQRDRFIQEFGGWLEVIGYRSDRLSTIYVSRWHRWIDEEILWNYTTFAVKHLAKKYPMELQVPEEILERARDGDVDCDVARAILIVE